MPIYQKVILTLLFNQDLSTELTHNQDLVQKTLLQLQTLNCENLADLYINIAFLTTSIHFLSEQHWLQKQTHQKEEVPFKTLIQSFFIKELEPILFLKTSLEAISVQDLKELNNKALAIEKTCITYVKEKNSSEQKIFIKHALALMSHLYEFENQLDLEKKRQNLHLGYSMYRTFDRLDELFNLNYNADHGMKMDLNNHERLYEGAGVGVQSGYSTILTALRYLNPSHGARFIDLGSGYGRVGLMVGLMRPDLNFKGYEYVQHRVDIANLACDHFNLKAHVQFYTQDLSSEEFKIPDAEIYYLYDPFSEKTYKYVLDQLILLSRRQKIAIATKGNAKGWLMDICTHEGWATPKEFDSGNLCLFES